MRQAGLLSWSPCASSPSSPSPPLIRCPIIKSSLAVSASVESARIGALTARERRQLRNENRESKAYNWREEVEERLIKKPKKKYKSWTEELNLDNLALLGPQWWVVRASRVSTQATAELLAKLLARNFPDLEFKVYVPSVHVKKRLKNGSYSDKSNPLFPGCVFLHCILNKEIHDFVREVDKVGGFLGSKVGNTKRQINRPKPVSIEEMEEIFQQAKCEQEQANKAFKEELQPAGSLDDRNLNSSGYVNSKETMAEKVAKPKKGSRKSSSQTAGSDKKLIPGSIVQVTSGPFAGFAGSLKEVNGKAGKAKVGFMLFGKESLADLDIDHIVVESTN